MKGLRAKYFPSLADRAEAQAKVLEQEAETLGVMRAFVTARGCEEYKDWLRREIVRTDDDADTTQGKMLINTGIRRGLRKALRHIESLEERLRNIQ